MLLRLTLCDIWSITYRGGSWCEDEEMIIPELSYLDPVPEHYSPRLETLKEMGSDIKREKGAWEPLLWVLPL